MPGYRQEHDHHRLIADRRMAQDAYQDIHNEQTAQIEAIISRLDAMHHRDTAGPSNKGDQTTFTVPQILGFMFALATVTGSLLAGWTNLNNQITSQKVSNDLIIAQIQKDITHQEILNKETHTKIDNIVVVLQGSIDKLSSRVAELDNTVNQVYSKLQQAQQPRTVPLPNNFPDR